MLHTMIGIVSLSGFWCLAMSVAGVHRSQHLALSSLGFGVGMALVDLIAAQLQTKMGWRSTLQRSHKAGLRMQEVEGEDIWKLCIQTLRGLGRIPRVWEDKSRGYIVAHVGPWGYGTRLELQVSRKSNEPAKVRVEGRAQFYFGFDYAMPRRYVEKVRDQLSAAGALLWYDDDEGALREARRAEGIA